MIPDVQNGALHLSAHVALKCAETDDDDSSMYSSDCSFTDFDESLADMEERVQEYSVMGNTPALAAMFFDTQGVKLDSNKLKKPGHFDGWSSCDGMEVEKKQESETFGMRKSISDVCIQSIRHNPKEAECTINENSTRPDGFLRQLLESNSTPLETRRADSIENFFVDFQPHDFEGYENDIARAVREGDLRVLQRHVRQGKSPICCNAFKESIVHTVCRRGHLPLLEFLLTKTNATVNIRDEQGRTPLHDAAWTHEPNFEMVKLLLISSPRLLLVEDSRGFTPLNYVGKQCWDDWCRFLAENIALLPTHGF